MHLIFHGNLGCRDKLMTHNTQSDFDIVDDACFLPCTIIFLIYIHTIYMTY